MASARSAGGLSARVPAILATVLAVAIVGLATASVLLGLRVYEKRQAEAAREAAVAAARQEMVNFLSLDHRTLDRDLDRVLQGATGEFKDMMGSGSSKVQDVMKEAKSSSEGEVLSAGIISIDKDSAEVLVVADATVRSDNTKKPTSRHYRAQLTLERHDGRWLVSNLRWM